MSDYTFNPDAPEPTPEEDDWEAAWRDLYETMDAEEPPASPSVTDWRAALADPETWQPWDVIHDEALIRSLLPMVTYGPERKGAGR